MSADRPVDDLATIDTLYDLAFLLMDLDRNGQEQAASIVLNRYLWRSSTHLDLQGLRALPLFLGLRASIRAMVTAERAEQEGSANVRAGSLRPGPAPPWMQSTRGRIDPIPSPCSPLSPAMPPIPLP